MTHRLLARALCLPTLLALAACDDDAGDDGGGGGTLPADGSAVCERFPMADVATATMMALDTPVAGGNDTPPRCSYQATDPGEPYITIQIAPAGDWPGDKAFGIDFQGGVAFDRVGVEGVLLNASDIGTTELRFLSAADASVFIQWGDATDPMATGVDAREEIVVRAGELVEAGLTR